MIPLLLLHFQTRDDFGRDDMTLIASTVCYTRESDARTDYFLLNMTNDLYPLLLSSSDNSSSMAGNLCTVFQTTNDAPWNQLN